MRCRSHLCGERWDTQIPTEPAAKIVEFRDAVQEVSVIGQSGQHRRPAVRILSRNQSVRVSLINFNCGGQGLSTAATAIQ